MNAGEYWQVFLETGAPEVFLLYQKAKRTEETDVLEGAGPGSAGDGLQG